MPLLDLRTRRAAWAAAGLTGALLVVAGCSGSAQGGEDGGTTASDEPATFEDVEVEGGAGEEPQLEFPTPLDITAEETQVRVLDEGDGPVVEAGQSVTVDYVGVNASDATQFDSSYAGDPATFPLVEGGLIQGFLDGLIGEQVGSRVLIGIPSEDGYDPSGGNAAAGIDVGDDLLFVVEIQSAETPLAQAEGAPVAPPAGLPGVAVDEAGRPTITLPEGAPPTEVVVQPLVQGEREVVQDGQTVTAHLTIVTWPGGDLVTSTFDQGGPARIPLTPDALPGFRQGLIGQPVGSRVLIVVPPDAGFGAEGNPQLGITGVDTLVMVVDVLDAD